MLFRSYFQLSILALVWALSGAYAHTEKVTHYYSPPTLAPENIVKKGLCVRPRVEDKPYDLNITTGDRPIITISGFGGAGYTLGPGAVQFQVEKFETEISEPVLMDLFKRECDSRDTDHVFGVDTFLFKIFGESPCPIQPSDGPFNNPPYGLNHKFACNTA